MISMPVQDVASGSRLPEETEQVEPDMHQDWIDEVLRFWFEEIASDRWFARDDELDARIRERFAALHGRIADLHVGDLNTPQAALAGVIVLDQFPRNIYRNTPRAFSTDALALAHSRYAIERGLDQEIPSGRRMFLYMPWQHAEDAAAQARSVELFDSLDSVETARYAREHKRIIDLFGRFPHRNAILGRASTSEELEFLKTHPGF